MHKSLVVHEHQYLHTHTNTPVIRVARGKGLIYCSLGLMVILQNFIVNPIEIPRRGSLFNSMTLYIVQYSAYGFRRLEKANHAVVTSL